LEEKITSRKAYVQIGFLEFIVKGLLKRVSRYVFSLINTSWALNNMGLLSGFPKEDVD